MNEVLGTKLPPGDKTSAEYTLPSHSSGCRLNLSDLPTLIRHAGNTAGLLYRQWWAVPSAILFTYLVAGLFAPSETASRYPRIELWEFVEATLFVASRIQRYAIPASALGVVVGFGLAWTLSRMPRHARYAAYVVVGALFVPIAALAFSQSPHIGLYSLLSLAGHFMRVGYAHDVLVLSTVAALCTFCIANLRRSRLFAGPASASSQNPVWTMSSPGPLLNGWSWSWVGLCFFASLSLTILAVWQSPESYGFRTRDVSSLWVPCWPYSPHGRIGEPGWGCPADSSYLLQWQVWLPQMSVLLVLASSIIMATWFASRLRRTSDSAASSAIMRDAPTRTRNRWLTLLPGILLAMVAAVFIGVVSPEVLAGACGGVALRALVSSRHRVSGYIFSGLLSAAVATCLLMLAFNLDVVFSRSRAIDLYLIPFYYTWPSVLLLVCLALFVTLTVLPMLRSRMSGRVLNVTLAALGGYALFALLTTLVLSDWWPSIGSVIVAADFIYAQESISQVHVLSAILGLLVGATFISRRRDVGSACNIVVWGGIGLPLAVALGMSNPFLEARLFVSYPDGFYGEGGRMIRNLLLALVVAYTCLWLVSPRAQSPHKGQSQGQGRFRGLLRCSVVAILVALSSACFVYVAESIVPYDENQSRILVAFDYARWLGDWDVGWTRMTLLYAYILELCVIAAAGIWAYLRARDGRRVDRARCCLGLLSG